MQRRSAAIALFCLCASSTPPAFAQASRYKDIEYSAIPEDSQIREGMAKMAAEGVTQIYVPPLFRYRLRLTATGAIRTLSDPRRSAIHLWGRTLRDGAAFVEAFTHEVEVRTGASTFWLPWQASLVSPFREELRSGGDLIANVLLAGAVPNEVLLLTISFAST